MNDATRPEALAPGADIPVDARWARYEQLKAAFKREHPGATAEQYEAAMRRITDELEL